MSIYDTNLTSGNLFNNNGGYPNGYPPVVPQTGVINNNPFISPFPQPQAMPSMPIPGVTAPLELVGRDGTTTVVPPTGNYNPGGARISQGGFNPVTNTVTQAVAGGFNPYTKFIGNPGYGVPQQQGFAPYCPTNNNGYYPQQPSYGGYGIGLYNPYYGQNEFDKTVQEYLYTAEPAPVVDTRALLEQVILTDEEREKVNHDRNINYAVGYDYYGRPIYNNGNYYQMNQKRQEDFEIARHNHQSFFTNLSKIVHAYYGEQIDEESAMKFYDPFPQQQIDNNKIFNFYTATEEEREAYNQKTRYQSTYDISAKMDRYEAFNQQLQMQKEAAHAQIRASHDKLIGVEPGQPYDLFTFLENGYKIGINMAMNEAKSKNRNGTTKYSRNDYRANLSQINNTPVPITSKDDEYVSIEEMLKSVYDRNKQESSNILKNNTGQITFTTEPAFPSEYDAHQFFLQAMQEKKSKDDLMKVVRSV